MFDSIFNIVMDVNDKTKYNMKARKDMTIYYNKPTLELKILHNGKILKTKAPFTLTKE